MFYTKNLAFMTMDRFNRYMVECESTMQFAIL